MAKLRDLDSTVTIEERYRGPDGSGNGGYVCGLVAGFLDGPATVTLRRPSPLGCPLTVTHDGDRVRLLDGKTAVAEGQPWSDPVHPLPPVSLDTARGVATDPAELGDHPFPRCFVCGPERDDGLRIFPGELGDGMLAGPWTPGEDLAGEDGRVVPRFVWAALDCPTGWAAATQVSPGTVALLGGLTCVIHAAPEPESPLMVVAKPDRQDGRKLDARSALYSSSGRLLAAAAATWIVVDAPR